MDKLKLGKKGYILIAGTLVISMACAVAISGKINSSANSKKNTAMERLLDKRDAVHSIKDSNKENDNEVVRAIVDLKADAVAETEEELDYSSELKSEEKKVIKNQEGIVKQAEKITGKKAKNRSGYLVNSFSIDATRKQIRQLAKIKGVESVNEAKKYKLSMNTAVDEGNVPAEWNDERYGYTGEGVVVAVLDTGVNFEHKDMVLDKGTKTKFSKEEWEEKIKLLGYGKYFSEKVPFGYDYTTGEDRILSDDQFHGYHVSGIVAGNNKNISGVARNAQIIGLKVLEDHFSYGTTDEITRGIEDAVKLGADIINMSIVGDGGIVSEDNYMQVAINNACNKGVICCIAGGNSGTISYLGNEKDKNSANVKDTSTVSSLAVAESCIAVSSANNIKDNGNGMSEVTMSDFTSWGPTNELGIKPEITAPGGHIKAAYTGTDGYEVYSGTSMATPFVAGGAAIMLGAIKERGLLLEEEQLVNFVKASLMNTADPVIDQTTGSYYSVRQQGSGMVDVFGAVDNDVLVTYNNKAKVELGEITSNTEIELTFTNYGKEDRSYTAEDIQIYTDYTVTPKESADGKTEIYGLKPVEGSVIKFSNNNISVPAGKSVTVKGMLNLSSAYEEDSYVEAFIKFKGNNVQDIGLPVLGFYGDFDKEPIIDKSLYEEGESFVSSKIGIKDIGTMFRSIDTEGEFTEVLGKEITKEMDSESSSFNSRFVKADDEDDEDDVIGEGEEAESIKVRLNEKYDLDLEQHCMFDGEYTAKSDGYINLCVDTYGFIEYSIYKKVSIFTDEGEEYAFEEIESETVEGRFSKEIKVENGETYTLLIYNATDGVYGNNEDNSQTGTVMLKKSDGSNYYTLKTSYNGEKVAFSPNGDGRVDKAIPIVTQLRNAKEITVKVLDSNKNVIGVLGNVYDICRCFYGYFTPKKLGISIYNGVGNGEKNIAWDGTIYNNATGEYKMVDNGQYYIQIEAKRMKNSIPNIVTMPIKVDLNKPNIDEFEVKKEKNDTVVYFKSSDDVGLSSYYYFDIQSEDGETSTIARRYVNTPIDEKGNYYVNFGKLDSSCKLAFMVEDTAGNVCYKDIVGNVDQNEEDEYDEEIEYEESNIQFEVMDSEAFSKSEKQGINTTVVLLNKITYPFSFKVKAICENGDIDPDTFEVEDSLYDETQEEEGNSLYKYEGDGIFTITLKEKPTGILTISLISNDIIQCHGIYFCENEKEVEEVKKYLSSRTEMDVIADNIRKEELNSDKTFTITGVIGVIPDSLTVNGIDADIDKEKMTFSVNIPIKGGFNRIILETKYKDIVDREVNRVYYNEMQIKLNELPEQDSEGVINVTNDNLALSGKVISYATVNRISVNGDNLFTSSDGRDYDTPLEKEFNCNVKLKKGMNIITIEAYDYWDNIEVVKLKVNYK